MNILVTGLYIYGILRLMHAFRVKREKNITFDLEADWSGEWIALGIKLTLQDNIASMSVFRMVCLIEMYFVEPATGDKSGAGDRQSEIFDSINGRFLSESATVDYTDDDV